ncbi:lantibiotic dehydratase C-terminal domain-containing protein [Nocardiopsis alba]|uniref:Lantibiotic dehydratase C-terminal domain-containing protein n=1 Tax=Nocardiopsis alba TaxID=53437 RepID=A0ABV5DZ18_9ACTN|nr:lantibiotic dehydratase C-terminal domain-containing protein [Nocardiopsis alba]
MSFTETGTETAERAEWFAVHVYLPYSLQTAFLCEDVAPLVGDLGARGRFFFLRYWKGGPHLRLRFDGRHTQVGPEEVVERLESLVPHGDQEARGQYDLQAASQAGLARMENEEVMAARPFGAVERFDYLPEYDKYGGPQGIEIAETVFCDTSGAVLDLLAATRRSTTMPVGEAVRAMAMSLRGVGLSAEESVPLLRGYEQRWSAFLPESSDAGWNSMYDKARDGLVNMCRKIWGPTEGDAFSDAYATATARARALFGEGPDQRLTDIRMPGTSYMECVAQYLHTTNNRLGLVPAGEALAAHLMHCALREL